MLQLPVSSLPAIIFLLQITLFGLAVARTDCLQSSAGTSTRAKRGCPMSPYATFLTDDQQQTLHELVTEARRQGADEDLVKEHIDKYISKILPPQRYYEFREAFARFEAGRREKRSAEGVFTRTQTKG
ncbi:unnamed protein product [Strongylus vulgaris]|uniref:Uncharacterized protein n=1 Tax=Strongylus vulgaris TaxID=40348 RepID=A0A3P7JRW5_STRVU|nr:unnamed protein product [Strongylus vulgaris]